jgi:glycosyltransferase involved in cell wall biosynthesis
MAILSDHGQRSITIVKVDLIKPVVLIPARHYLPGYKAGGPIRSLAAICCCLGDEFDFRIVTSDRDYGETEPFKGIVHGRWNFLTRASVWYLTPGKLSLLQMIHLVRESRTRLLYVNSFFDPVFSIFPLLVRWAGILRKTPVLLAPRGELSPGAMKQKTFKKELFLRWAGRMGLFKDVFWHASTMLEKEEIERIGKQFPGICPAPDRILLARNLVTLEINADKRSEPKKAGELRAVFLSRISPKKNLAEAIRLLGQVGGPVSLDVYGVLDPATYWDECQTMHASFAPRVLMNYRGPVPHENTISTFSQYDVFVFPTLGENFGHAILESLTGGCPILVSDQTPWRDLASKNAGFDISLSDTDAWVKALRYFSDMTEAQHVLWRQGARALADRMIHDAKAIDDHRSLFTKVMKEPGNEDR